ncbi:DUF7835 family putative zinc beta-ribbon protein [Halegenticoccus soli]
MRSRKLRRNETLEDCPRCGRETVHRVALKLKQTSTGGDVSPENVKFARKPVRTTACLECDARSRTLRDRD